MTVLHPLAQADGPGSSGPTGGRRAGRWLALVASIVVAAAVGAVGWWVVNPVALRGVGDSVELPLAVGDSAVITMYATPMSGDVRLVRAEPVITENSAGATVRALLCGNPAEFPPKTTIGTSRGRAEQVCSTTGPPRASALGQVSPDAPYLVIEVTPRRPGTVTVEGLNIRYRAGLQRGEQDSGLVVTVRASASD